MTQTQNNKSHSDLLNSLRFNADGLIPAIAQDAQGGEVLMMAWMNAEAIIETLSTGRVCYWTRTRQKLWRKGEKSGQVQKLVDFLIDCDGDTVLLKVHQTGVACHTGRRSCFYRAVKYDNNAVVLRTLTVPEITPEDLYGPKETENSKEKKREQRFPLSRWSE